MKRRLVLAVAGVAASAVALFALPLGIILQRTYRDEELLRLQRDTVAATRGVDLSAGTGDRLELPRSADILAVYAGSGTLLAGHGPPLADAPVRSALSARRPAGATVAGRLVVAVPVLSGERIAGAVRAQRGQGGVDRRTDRAWLALAALAAALVALAVVAALALGRQLVRPLEKLAAAARRVGDGDFATRAEVTHIREIDDVADALNRSSHRIDELVNRERAFSADASHQLRTPLAALRLELEALALTSYPPSEELSAALAQVDRLESTVETLLAVARGTPREAQRTDLRALVAALEVRWHGTLAAEGRPLRVRVETGPSIAAMSPVLLEEIAEVLMQNAREHGAGAVTITVRRLGAALALEVADRGPGFGADPESAFARGSGSGHGIGLALARSLAHAEGARLQITRPEPGPTVSVLIQPASEADLAEAVPGDAGT
ncbi:MAG: HAMP domain-containing sensor histidine kinase [Thermoleophilaceae bacterium]